MEKEYIIKSNQEIEELIKKKQSVVSKYFIIYYQSNETNHLRLCVSVSKKNGNAVERNHQKRRIKEVLRSYKDTLPLDVLLIAKKNSMEIDFNELKKQIDYVISKLNKEKKCVDI